jgi:hypothetical protein
MSGEENANRLNRRKHWQRRECNVAALDWLGTTQAGAPPRLCANARESIPRSNSSLLGQK